MHKNRNEEFQS